MKKKKMMNYKKITKIKLTIRIRIIMIIIIMKNKTHITLIVYMGLMNMDKWIKKLR